MKKILYLALILWLPTSVLLADGNNHRTEGIWFSSNTHHELQIKAKAYGLKVRGLPDHNRKWKRFYSTRQHNVFKDARGNTLVRRSNNQLVFYLNNRDFRSRNRSYRFFRDRNDRYRNDRYRSGRYEYDGSVRNRDRDYGFEDDGYYDDYEPRVSPSSIRRRVVGEWKTVGMDRNRRVTIKSTNAGIQARIKGKTNWVFFAQDSRSPRSFVDRKGNEYRIKNDGTLKWKGVNGKEFILEKF